MQGVWKNRDFRPISPFNSDVIHERTIVTMECEQETAPKLSTGIIFSDLERPLTEISRSHNYFTLTISETVRDRHSYKGMLIGTYTRPTEGCHLKRPWMILDWLSDIFNDSKHQAVSLRQLSFLLALLYNNALLKSRWISFYKCRLQTSVSHLQVGEQMETKRVQNNHYCACEVNKNRWILAVEQVTEFHCEKNSFIRYSVSDWLSPNRERWRQCQTSICRSRVADAATFPAMSDAERSTHFLYCGML